MVHLVKCLLANKLLAKDFLTSEAPKMALNPPENQVYLLNLKQLDGLLRVVDHKPGTENYLNEPEEDDNELGFVAVFLKCRWQYVKTDGVPDKIFKLRLRKICKDGTLGNLRANSGIDHPRDIKTRVPRDAARFPKSALKEDQYEIERIVEAFQKDKETHYVVKWVGYGLERTAYLPQELGCPWLIDDYLFRQCAVQKIFRKMKKPMPKRRPNYFQSAAFEKIQALEWSINYLCERFSQAKLYIENWSASGKKGGIKDFEFSLENTFSEQATSLLQKEVIPRQLRDWCTCKDDCGEASSKSGTSCCLPNKTPTYANGLLRPGLLATSSLVLYECSCACKCYGHSCSNKVIQNGRKIPLMLFWTEEKDWGVYAMERIPRGTFISEYVGHVLTTEECEERVVDVYLFKLHGGRLYVDAKFRGNESRFLNHSCEPNCRVVKVNVDFESGPYHRYGIFASKTIESGEELSFDYFGNPDHIARINEYKRKRRITTSDDVPICRKCHCGSKKCRLVFSAGDVELEEEKKKCGKEAAATG
ncbi:hypothetical protein L596_017964 [Steinernema carpocapsae]|uniref:SET domain-containing protein n=1 Tax=Steinernema carpocapsae TaxID=34508 RepID=A0A4U5N411_STECR|nr:hypothetical protein L596_017964 [Steinernema carpocapsae]